MSLRARGQNHNEHGNQNIITVDNHNELGATMIFMAQRCAVLAEKIFALEKENFHLKLKAKNHLSEVAEVETELFKCSQMLAEAQSEARANKKQVKELEKELKEKNIYIEQLKESLKLAPALMSFLMCCN